MSLERQFHDAILRRSFDAFLHRVVMTLNPGTGYLPNWHHSAIATQLQRMRRGGRKRLIINMPPRHLKSQIVSVAFPAYLLGLEPWHRIMCVSYGSELSSKHHTDFRSIVASPWYRRAFPEMRVLRSLEEEVTTTAAGFRRATSVYGSLTGFGGDIFIIDDPQKPIDAQSESQRDRLNHWVSNTLVSRLDNQQTGAIILVTQRVHLNDLSGYLMELGGWEVLSLPATAVCDERIAIGDHEYHCRSAGEALHSEWQSIDTLRRVQEEIGSPTFAAQYQQSPVPPGGGMIERKWLRYYDELPQEGQNMRIIQSWDTAAKDGIRNDYSVCTTWMVVDMRSFYLMDVTRGHYDYPTLRRTAVALAEKYNPEFILIEDASTGTALGQDLEANPRKRFRFAVRLVPIEQEKVGRLFVHQAKFERGEVLFPLNAEFLPTLLAELLSFPQSRYNDQVDSLSQALSLNIGYDTTYKWL
jgi:predicted phage terminase large subunit-like protein